LWDRRLVSNRIPTPSDATAEVGGVIFDAHDLLALIVTPFAVGVVAVALRHSAAGVAIRASADDADRASLLGIPVHRLHTVVWSAAAVLAFVTIFLRGGILGLPTGTVLGFSVLLRALVALVLGRLTNLVAVSASAVALGVLELAIAWDHPVGLVEPILGLVVLIALVVQRRDGVPTGDAEASAWQAAEEIRPIAPQLARLPVVRWGRWLLLAGVIAGAAAFPHVVAVDTSLRASALLIYAVLGLSLVVLSGWGGHVSLGQVAFFALGAAVCGWVTSTRGADLFAGLVLAAVAGAVVAMVVGIPAIRLRGLPLAVTTFAFSLATTSYLLNEDFFDWVPRERIERPPLIGGLEISTPTEVYLLALVLLVVVGLGVRGIRSSRTGRALVAMRDNDRAAQSYGIHAARTRLMTFALAGAIAALAGALFVHHQQSFDPSSYSPLQNLAMFTMVVIGGLTSVTGAVLGAVFLLCTQVFLPDELQILASGLGVLAVLWLAPGGLATVAYRGRDWWLRRVAAANCIDLAAASAEDATATEGQAAVGTDAGREAGRGGERTESSAGVAPRPLAQQRAGAAFVAAAHDNGGRSQRPTLTVEGLDVSYGSVQVVFGVDLDVHGGEAVALLGTNGAGKSTLLRAVSGLLPPRAGTVVFDGIDITGRAPHAVAALGLIHMPGGAGVFPSLTVAENLRAAGWLHRRHPAAPGDGRAEVDRLFPVLAERSDHTASSLSGGQQQMLTLAMTLLTRPRLLMIDELSLGLAPVVVGRLLQTLDELRQRGTTIVLVDQSVNVAVKVADRAVFLERGQVRFSGPAAGLLDRPDLLRSVFLGSSASPGSSAAPGHEAAVTAGEPVSAPATSVGSGSATASG
ncbi:MAG: ATP-binding cassette domain-containing protein, partial [Actinomycetota bacterium]|nr:ATP-binding cassette domain-containing protein [Actinomycetota bacterium]